MRSVFVLVPSLISSGPIKGAVALCNGLVKYVPVTLVPLKKVKTDKEFVLDLQVKVLQLADHRNWLKKYFVYRRALKEAGPRQGVVSLSFCFSADTFNFFMARHATIMSSVRGNLPKNYRIEHGVAGSLAALFHLGLLRRFMKVFTISSAMLRQLKRFGLFRAVNLGNFLDEGSLEHERVPRVRNNGVYRFIFLGRLAPLKRPELLINAVAALRARNIDCRLDLVGDGPMRDELGSKVKHLGLGPFVAFHGYVPKPYGLLQKADCMVLPSETEGISRAALEALFLGVPAVLRRVDGNRELISPGVNGELFACDEELPVAMARIVGMRRQYYRPQNLLPDSFRQEAIIQRFLSMAVY